MFNLKLGLALSLALLVPAAVMADISVGTSNSNNTIPFTAAQDFETITYQQVYGSSAFSGTTSFNQISFFLASESNGGDLDSGTYDIYFSYTSQPVDGLSSSSPGANIGADETLFGAYTLPGGIAPSTLTFSGNTFDYDPTMGNLLMTINISGAVDHPNGLTATYEADSTGTVTSRAYFGASTAYPYTEVDDLGLVTSFNDVVPEPSSLILFGTSLLGLGGTIIKRKW